MWGKKYYCIFAIWLLNSQSCKSFQLELLRWIYVVTCSSGSWKKVENTSQMIHIVKAPKGWKHRMALHSDWYQNLKVKYEYKQAWNSSDWDFPVIAILPHWPLSNIILSSSLFSALLRVWWGAEGGRRDVGKGWHRDSTRQPQQILQQPEGKHQCSSWTERYLSRAHTPCHSQTASCAHLHAHCTFP